MARQLQLIAGLVLTAVLLSLLSYQFSVTKVQENEPIELLRSLRAKLAEAEVRAASAEARVMTLGSKLALVDPSAAAETAAAAAAASTALSSSQSAAATPAPAAVQYIHTISTLSPHAKPGDLMMMTYATGGVREMLYNWVLHVQRLGERARAIRHTLRSPPHWILQRASTATHTVAC
eukprot:2822550-Prymnesium_polylepis.1